jgi:hypothetical protein
MIAIRESWFSIASRLRAGRPSNVASSPHSFFSSQPWDLFWCPPTLLSNEYWGLFLQDECGRCVKLNIYLYLVPRLRRDGAIFLLLHSSSWRRLYPRCIGLIGYSLQILINWKAPVIALYNTKILYLVSLNIRSTENIWSNNWCTRTKRRNSVFEADVKWQHFLQWCVLSRFSEFDILAVVTVKSTVLGDVTPWSLLEFYSRCRAFTLTAREWVELLS